MRKPASSCLGVLFPQKIQVLQVQNQYKDSKKQQKDTKFFLILFIVKNPPDNFK
jgi:hypothetical protein